MLVYKNSCTEPYHNLAAEEFLLENTEGDILTIWRNSPSVIIGKNQNAFAEIDQKFLSERGIKLVRRLTGGGAVYHDLGNICFTFISDNAAGLDFARFLVPVSDALRELGFKAEISGRNDITVGGIKISGNAQCVYRPKNSPEKTRVMHHGTLLYDTDLSVLSKALRVNPLKMQAKGITSVRSRVENLRVLARETGLPSADMSPEDFFAFLEKYLSEKFSGKTTDYSDADLAEIDRLAKEKYSRWEYDFGASKNFLASYGKYFPFGYVEISLNTDGGMITGCSVTGDFFGEENIRELEAAILGCRFSPDDISDRLSGLDVGKYIHGASADDIKNVIFG